MSTHRVEPCKYCSSRLDPGRSWPCFRTTIATLARRPSPAGHPRMAPRQVTSAVRITPVRRRQFGPNSRPLSLVGGPGGRRVLDWRPQDPTVATQAGPALLQQPTDSAAMSWENYWSNGFVAVTRYLRQLHWGRHDLVGPGQATRPKRKRSQHSGRRAGPRQLVRCVADRRLSTALSRRGEGKHVPRKSCCRGYLGRAVTRTASRLAS